MHKVNKANLCFSHNAMVIIVAYSTFIIPVCNFIYSEINVIVVVLNQVTMK